MNRATYTWKNIEYLEKPVTPEERAVAAVLKGTLDATLSNDIAYLASVTADDATIMLFQKENEFMTKTAYLEKMTKIAPSVRGMKYKNVLIRMTSDWRATVSCVRYVRFQNSREVLTNRIFELRKDDAEWKVTRVAYY